MNWNELAKKAEWRETLIELLSVPTPDPDTGLMPCGCEYCEDGFECDTNHFHTRPDWMLLNDINDCIPAHYCPNCGRHLASDQAKEGGE